MGGNSILELFKKHKRYIFRKLYPSTARSLNPFLSKSTTAIKTKGRTDVTDVHFMLHSMLLEHGSSTWGELS